MRLWFTNLLFIVIISIDLTGCAIKNAHELNSGEYYFEKGYYKRAMGYLLPPAHHGNPRAQYAVGYMYYYGYGVPQNTDTGYYWIRRAARCHDPKAIEAVHLIEADRARPKRTYSRYL
jgi:TPR repeat protein